MTFTRWAAAASILPLLILGAVVPLAAAEPSPHAKATVEPLPEAVKYWVLFRHLKALDAKAAEVEMKGQDGERYRRVIRDSVKLSEGQDVQLRKVASDCLSRLEEKDREALRIIRAARAAAPAGQAKGGKAPPAPPAELARLQGERDALLDEARESLRRDLGEKDFARLQSFVDEKIAPTVRRQRVAPAGGGQ